MSMFTYGKLKLTSWLNRLFKEEKGGAELIATLVIVGIVLVLAFAFKEQLTGLVKDLWNNLIADGKEGTKISDVAAKWE